MSQTVVADAQVLDNSRPLASSKTGWLLRVRIISFVLLIAGIVVASFSFEPGSSEPQTLAGKSLAGRTSSPKEPADTPGTTPRQHLASRR
jgi:hypothetical protein